MNKSMKRKLGIVFSVIGGVAFSCGSTIIGNAYANENAFDLAQIDMMKGASVRYYTDDATTKESGIRFSSIIDFAQYEALEAMESSEGVKVSYGMVIAPYEYYQNVEFNEATIFGVNGDKKYTWDGDSVEDATAYTKIAHVTYDSLIVSKQAGYENYYELKGSLINIKEENLTKEFIGRGYIKYESNGVTKYKFATYSNDLANDNVRSIVYVSQLAIDTNDEASSWLDKNYVQEVADQTTSYTVETYVGENLVKSESFEGVTIDHALENVTVAEYEGFESVSAQTSGKVYANGRLTLKHVYKEEENSVYQVKNGGFEAGMDGWTKVGEIGDVSSETNYWYNDSISANGFAFGMDGEKMFSAYAVDGLEKNMGYLQSSTFTVSQSGWMTYKLGGAKNSEYVYLEVVEASTGNILKRYYNQNHKYEEVNGVRLGCELNAFKANLSGLEGKSVYIRVSDFASGDFGLFFLDSVDTLYLAEPQGFTLATEIDHQATIYDLYNGNFDKDMRGWTKTSNIGDISESPSDWFGNFNNVEKYFSCYAPGQEEGARGTLRSNVFEIGGCGWITFNIGGVKNPDQVYMEVIDAVTGVKYGHFYNEFMRDCELIRYKADLSAYIGKLVYINFVDNATGDYGLIFCDEFHTYYANVNDVPGYNVAVNKVESIYNVMNGGFETGNLLGWTLVSGEVPGRVTDINYFWNDANRVIDKDGNFSFTGVELNPDNGNLEYRKGTLRSNTFILKENSSISFKMGGSGANRSDVCLRIVNAVTGEVIAWYSNPDFSDATLKQYNHVIGNATEMACYVEIYDDATENWGLLGLDSINVYQA